MTSNPESSDNAGMPDVMAAAFALIAALAI
jgi:hypothetical protein